MTTQCVISCNHYFPWVHPSVSKWILMYPLSSPESVQFGDTPSPRQWILVGVADSSQLGTPERTKKLEELKQKSTKHGKIIAANLV